MRDILVTLIVFGSLPLIFKRPWFGMVMWIWISVMNPHSQGWGFARTYPFAAIIAATTMLAILFSKDKKRLPMNPVTVTFILFALWMGVTSLFAIHPDQIGEQWSKVYKIFGMTLVVLMLLTERKHIEWMIWTVVVSVGYYGVKGGLFTIRSGGGERVWGPAGTFIDGNNEVALAFVMVIPLMVFLRSMTANKWGRRALVASMLLCALAALGTYSRGAALAIGAMVIFLWLKSRDKFRLGVLIAIAVPALLLFMPDKWHERIDTIGTYQQDSSAMGRINAWHMAVNLANDRPLVGGGFQIYDAQVFARYAPVPDDIHAAHSIYFQVLGEHGYVGLLLYLLLGVLTWRTGSWVVRRTRAHSQLKWAHDLATMTQVSLLGFMVGGAFLSLAYFDVPYYLMCGLVALRLVVERELKRIREDAHAPAAEVAPQLQTARRRRA
ncbi:putative O-glycosylation ligase, exosortase A system-associated [Massilia horti]|uniref:Putative O-glycosylation ligase, exosortase A system-associated n=1 Tax=Massilia horti TaxID=2562153 RepID=A0A4Y9SYP2_9BURK|nr:putative O-glycosylation ligase, exosortase A system-associated [Massilia horti]TFW30677.1 putative O-glycosylation ligase, exosortase A system-associated [Massilia horti]